MRVRDEGVEKRGEKERSKSGWVEEGKERKNRAEGRKRETASSWEGC